MLLAWVAGACGTGGSPSGGQSAAPGRASSSITEVPASAADMEMTIGRRTRLGTKKSASQREMNAQPGADPSGQWANTREGLLRVENATGVSLTGCRLTAVGASGGWVESGAAAGGTADGRSPGGGGRGGGQGGDIYTQS